MRHVHSSVRLLLVGCLSMIAGCSTAQFWKFFEGSKQNQGNTSIRVAPLSAPVPFAPTFDRVAFEDLGIRLSDSADRAFSKGDSIRVRVRRVHVAYFSESNGTEGEIAVLVTVKEGDAGAPGESADTGRVVYYQDGTDRHGDMLEFDGLHVYGPITYKGGTIYIRVSLVEMDEKDNERNSALLATLSGLGGKAYPPASPLLAVLEEVGEAIIKANGNDIDMDFRIQLSELPMDGPNGTPSPSNANYVNTWLRTGHYVLIRAPENHKDLTQSDWESIRYDLGTGILYSIDDNGTESEYVDNTYVILMIEKGMAPYEQDGKQTLSQMHEELNKQLADSPAETKKLIDELKVLYDGIRNGGGA